MDGSTFPNTHRNTKSGPHVEKKLNAAFVRSAPQGRHTDGGGLFLCAQAVLSAMSTTVSSWGRVEAIHGDTAPLSTYSITVAQSGERKTAVDSLVQRGIKAFERKLEHELGERQRLFDAMALKGMK